MHGFWGFTLVLEVLSIFDASLREVCAKNSLLEMDLKIKILYIFLGARADIWLLLLRTTSGLMYW